MVSEAHIPALRLAGEGEAEVDIEVEQPATEASGRATLKRTDLLAEVVVGDAGDGGRCIFEAGPVGSDPFTVTGLDVSGNHGEVLTAEGLEVGLDQVRLLRI